MLCKKDGCPYPVKSKGLCSFHYNRNWAATTERPIDHGTPGAYVNRMCRCDLCREAGNASMARYRAKKKKASE